MEFMRVPKKGGSGRVPEKVESRRVSERWNPGEYRKNGIWESTEKVEFKLWRRVDPGECGKLEFGRVPKKWNSGKYRKKYRIRASAGKVEI